MQLPLIADIGQKYVAAEDGAVLKADCPSPCICVHGDLLLDVSHALCIG
jgi:hypothetical protein